MPKRNRDKKRVTQQVLAIKGYDYITRSISEGRGVIIYFKEILIVQSVDILNDASFAESIWIRVKLKGSDSLLIGNIYRSPASSELNNYELNNVFRKAVELKHSHLLILGDFNYGGLNWELQQSSDSINDSSSVFMETVNDLFLYQHVGENTRYRGDQTPSRLDLIFTNEINMITDLDYMPPIGASDHSCLLFDFVCYTCKKQQNEKRPNFYKGNYQVVREVLVNTNWNSVENENVEVFWGNLHKTLTDVIEEHIPKIKPSNKTKKKPWLNYDAILAVESKKRAWKKYKNCKSKQNYQKYAEIRNKATSACRSAKVFYEKELAANIKTDAKSFWNYVKSQSKTSVSIGDLEDSNGLLTSSDTQKAEILNAFISSVFTEESTDNMPMFEEREFDELGALVKWTVEFSLVLMTLTPLVREMAQMLSSRSTTTPAISFDEIED